MTKTLRFCLGLFTLLVFTFNVHSEEYYRSLDHSGGVHYGDSPIAGAANIVTIKPPVNPIPSAAPPYLSQRAHEKFPVTLYIADGCGGGCDLAATYLAKRGIPYTEHYLHTRAEYEAFKVRSGGNFIPTLTIGEHWFIGFSHDLWERELDLAAYPKTAPYGFHPKPIIKVPETK
ncbi:MAG: glutaredoxin family protein [Gallionellaceae bacterium]